MIMIEEYFNFALTNLKYRQLRSWFTIIGIVIGIAAIVSLISLSWGLQDSITEQFEKLGSARVYIAAGEIGFSGPGRGLTIKDVKAVEKVSAVEWVNPFLIVSSDVTFERNKEFIYQLLGIETEDLAEKWSDIGLDVDSGRMLKKGDKYSAMIGYKTSTNRFDKQIRVGNDIQIKGVDFKVVGVMEEVGNSEDDNSVYIPMEIARKLFNQPEEVTAVEVKIKRGQDIELAADKIERELKKIRDEKSFSVLTPQQILRQMGEILGIVQAVLVGIAAISLLVGAVGIMNSMYTSVLERTKEIGVMKSIGASEKNILMIFLFESGIQGAVGGVIGSTLGVIISILVGKLARSAGFGMLKITVNPVLILFGIGFAVVVGLIAGYLPSRQAQKITPAEALRQ